MTKTKINILSLCCFVLTCSSVGATVFTANSSKDAWLPYDNGEQANANYGSYQYLMMSSTNPGMAVLQFDISAIPTNAHIDGAVLKLNIEQKEDNYRYDVYRNTSAWNESSVSWNTRPTVSQDDTWQFLQALNTTVQFGMTDFVKGWMSGTNDGITIVSNRCQPLDAPIESELAPTIYSREYSDLSLQPLLTVTYHIPEVTEPSSILALLCGLGGLTAFKTLKHK